MLVVKIELWPGGRVTMAREIGRVFISNQSDLADESNYIVKAEQAGAPHLGIEPTFDQFEIFGHNRKQSVFNLLAKVFARFLVPEKTKSE